jgi:hypothetical protein
VIRSRRTWLLRGDDDDAARSAYARRDRALKLGIRDEHKLRARFAADEGANALNAAQRFNQRCFTPAVGWTT